MTDRSTAQSHLDLLQVVDRTPALADETFLRHVEVEHVERVVDRFDLAHLDEPHLDVLGGGHQHAVTVVLSLTEHLSITSHFHHHHHQQQQQQQQHRLIRSLNAVNVHNQKNQTESKLFEL